MRYFFISAFALLLHSGLKAQTRIDTLENLLKQNLADTARVRVLVDLSAGFHYSDFKKAKSYADEAMSVANTVSRKETKILALSNMGFLHTLSGDFRSALDVDNQALKLAIELNDSAKIAVNYNNIANDYFDLGDYDDAYYYFSQSYLIADKLKNYMRMGIAAHNIGRVYKELGLFEDALRFFVTADQHSQRAKDDQATAFMLHEQGDLFMRNDKLDSAMILLNKSLALSKSQKINQLEPRTFTVLAQSYFKMGNIEKALANYDSALLIHQATNNEFGIAEVNNGRGTVLVSQGKYDQALPIVEQALAVARDLNASGLEMQCLDQLASLWEKKGDYRKALEYFKQHKTLEDKAFSQDMQQKLVSDQVRFQTNSKDSELAALYKLRDDTNDQIKKQEFIRNILVVVMALSGILLATVYRSGQRRKQINNLLLQHQEETEKKSVELERLNQVKDKFFSIISHDLRSPINALAGLLDLLDKGAVSQDEFPKHIHELKTRFNHTRTLLNNLLDWTLLQMDKLNLQPSRIDLKKITDENIQMLEGVQTKHIKLLNQIPTDSIAFADANTTNLVIRNLMMNAIKFTNDGGEIIITGQDKGREWIVCVKDNGIGIAPDVMKILFDKTAPYTTRGTANEKGTGLGLILCKEFVEKNGGQIWVESTPGKGSTFFFTIPKP